MSELSVRECPHYRFNPGILEICESGCGKPRLYIEGHKAADEQLASAVEELHTLRDFVRSLNSLAFEEWRGKYVGKEFVIFDGEGCVAATGADAYEAWRNLTAAK